MLKDHTNHLLAAIEACIISKFTLPALILIYSAIDIMAWLNRSEDHEDVTRSDFISWTDTFLLPNSDLSCTAIDLYAARCALVHSYTAQSKLSREGNAKEIYYAWGNADEQELQKIIDQENHEAKAVHVEKLFYALKIGVEKFVTFAQQTELVRIRAEKFFKNLPADLI